MEEKLQSMLEKQIQNVLPKILEDGIDESDISEGQQELKQVNEG